MFTLSNAISLLRGPLGLLFIVESNFLRTILIILAMLTDSVDGYLARRYKFTSRFGAILDPLMDKFFVFSALGVLCFEREILLWQALAMISRDLFLCLFGFYLTLFGNWKTYEFKAIRWGKITTALQFCFLIAIVNQIKVAEPLFCLFILLGFFAFIELLQREFSSKNFSK